MSEETSAAPAAETSEPTTDIMPTAADAAPSLDADDLSALSGDATLAEPEDTITIGEHTIPVSALTDLPDDVLRRIKRKVKAAGEEREVSLLEALEAVPKAAGWQRRQWEAAQREKELREAASMLPNDTIRAVMQLRGVDRREATNIIAEQLVAELEEAEMSPQERAQRQRQRELEAKAAQADEYERRQREAENARAVKAAEANYVRGVKEALGASGLAASDYNVGRVAMVLSGAIDAGIIGDPTPEDMAWAAGEVAKHVANERRAYISDPNAFIRAHPEEARAIARAYASRIKAQQPPPERAAPPKRRDEQPERFESMAEWEAWANKRMGA